ncbi:heavy metal translocating P-type ATPase [Parendozoicomonas sp. Alg238-R29]|uniref:heavy metal translocating P-type ATPase n=1 Tax=Parendozoicomonas sp. Alg238-R29 TaxID=2993446 RepID=UPI00248E393D|nr:heavy metal translocating P-type ATPase [Parendozoicomonas sp. Alg238-R29]
MKSDCCNSGGCHTAHYHEHGYATVQEASAGTAVSSSDGQSSEAGGCCGSGAEDEDPESELSDSNIRCWHISGIDCPSCVKKVQTALTRVDSVVKAHVSFSTMRLQVEFTAGSANVNGVMTCIDNLGYRLTDIGEQAPAESEQNFFKKYASILVFGLLLGFGALVNSVQPEIGRWVLTLAALFGIFPIGKKALSQARSGTPFGIETLMTVAALGALVLGETLEAGMVLLLFMIGEHLEGLAANRARQGVESLMALSPDKMTRIIIGANGEETKEEILASQLMPEDIVEVRPGDRLATDGELITDAASFDESSLTGESVPVDRLTGETVMAGSLCADRVARLKVVSEPGNNAIDRVVRLIEEAEESKAPIERFIDKFSRWYTPLMMAISALVVVVPPLVLGGDWGTWVYRGLTLLLISCPCALVISTPAAVTSGLARAARQGFLIKGGAVLEQLGEVQQVAFDKTGTLTEGRPQVVDVIAFGCEKHSVLSMAAAVEDGSRHPLAQAIVRKAKKDGLEMTPGDNVSAQAGKGVSGQIDGATIVVGSPKYLAGEINSVSNSEKCIADLEERGYTVVGVTHNSELIGVIAISDTLRADSQEAIQRLNALGVSSIMLTGDNPRAAAAIAEKLEMDFRAGLLPEDKVKEVRALEKHAPIAMVGDGINDAPALKSAHVGIAMGSGTDVALETADAALTHERVRDLADMIDLSRATMQVVRQNVIFAIALKVVFLMTSLTGLTGLMLAVIADSGATALVTMNSLRLLRRKNSFK